MRGRRGTDPRGGASHRRSGERGRLRGPGHSAGTQQHAVLLSEQAVVDPHRKLRQTRWPASAFIVRAAVPQHSGRRPDPGHRCADHRRTDPEQRHPPGNADRPSGSIPGDGRREQQPSAFTGRLQRVPRGVQLARTDGGHRRRDRLHPGNRRGTSVSRWPKRRSSIWSSRTTHSICVIG